MHISPLNIHDLLQQYGLSPKKSLGQNFLIDTAYLQKIINAASLSQNDIVLEIGPGLGSLTRYLAEFANCVVAVEIDRELITPLEDVLSPYKNVKVILGDILAQEIESYISSPNYIVVANIPYNITSNLIRHLLEAKLNPKKIILTIQEEVADRICADPPNMSRLALSVQVFGKPEKLIRIPAGAFYPVPSVNSATIKIDIFEKSLIQDEQLNTFFKLVNAGFSQKRKTIRNSLGSKLHITKESISYILNDAGIDSMRRAQTLSILEWEILTKLYIDYISK